MRDLLVKSGVVFIAMVLLDIVFALYVVTTAAKDVLASSLWAGAIQVCNVFVVVSYIRDRRLVVACTAGAFVGTWLAMTYL